MPAARILTLAVMCAALLAGCGSNSPVASCTACDAGGASQPDSGGIDGGIGPIDLRFRGAESGLQLTGTILGGDSAGQDVVLRDRGSAFAVADLEDLGFDRLLVAPRSLDVQYSSETIATANQCPSFFSSLMDGHFVISGIGGDPTLPTCTLSAISADGGPSYTYLAETGTSLDALKAQLAATEMSRSYVVTAISATDGGVAYVAESVGPLPDGGLESYDSQIATVGESDFEAQVEAMADAGYVITAANSSFRNFVLVGTRPSGSVAQHSAHADQVPPNFAGDAQSNQRQAEGYTPTFYVDDVVAEPDGGFDGGFYLLWQK